MSECLDSLAWILVASLGFEKLMGSDLSCDNPMLARWLEQRPELYVLLEQERENAASQFLNDNKLRGRPAPVLVKVEDEAIAYNSSALGLLAQQVSRTITHRPDCKDF